MNNSQISGLHKKISDEINDAAIYAASSELPRHEDLIADIYAPATTGPIK